MKWVIALLVVCLMVVMVAPGLAIAGEEGDCDQTHDQIRGGDCGGVNCADNDWDHSWDHYHQYLHCED